MCYGCVINLLGHLKVIQHQLLTINHENRSTNVVSKELCELIRYHTYVIDLCDELNDIASPFVFIQFVIASVQICVVAFQMTLVKEYMSLYRDSVLISDYLYFFFKPFESLVTSLIYVSFLISVSFQCFVFCHAGSLLYAEV